MALSDEQIVEAAEKIVTDHIQSIEYLDIVESLDEQYPDVEWEMAEAGDYGKVSRAVEKILHFLRSTIDNHQFGE